IPRTIISGVTRIMLISITGLMFMTLLTGCNEAKGEILQSTDIAMGTIINQTIYVNQINNKQIDSSPVEPLIKDSPIINHQTYDNNKITDEILSLINELEDEMLSWRKENSEIANINKNAGNQNGTEVSEELYEILLQLTEIAKDSKGALDITIGEVVNLWDIDTWSLSEKESLKEYQLPKKEVLENALERSGYEKIELLDSKIRLPEGVLLNLGAIGKGYACEKVIQFLRESPTTTGAVLSIGGSIATYGNKEDGSPWTIGIINPFSESEYLGFLSLQGEWYVSTSGDYERYIEIDGKRYHHIIDPSTGYPAESGLASVTILCKNGLLSDALSTACFILGKEDGLELCKKYEVLAVMVDFEGEIYMTEGMEAYFVGK
ncbi:FAD:protein FMN transferase, partial [Lachnospiraceae bacterium OttesenSCG-928-D06]|nr:FAD:protein FMN transferase [Lachnospiraceae bacterium OttesenSCG-928-D06]